MVRAQASILIERPAATAIYGCLVDDFERNYKRWSPEVQRLDLLTPGPLRVGTRARQVRVDQGRRTETTFQVRTLERPKRVCFAEIRNQYRIDYVVEAVGDQRKRAVSRLTFGIQLSRLELYMRPFETHRRGGSGRRNPHGEQHQALGGGQGPGRRCARGIDSVTVPIAELESARYTRHEVLTMEFIAEKDPGLIPFVLSQILDTVVTGITLSDPDQPDNPVVYANAAFEMITGYEQDEIIGETAASCRGTIATKRRLIKSVRPCAPMNRSR